MKQYLEVFLDKTDFEGLERKYGVKVSVCFACCLPDPSPGTRWFLKYQWVLVCRPLVSHSVILEVPQTVVVTQVISRGSHNITLDCQPRRGFWSPKDCWGVFHTHTPNCKLNLNCGWKFCLEFISQKRS